MLLCCIHADVSAPSNSTTAFFGGPAVAPSLEAVSARSVAALANSIMVAATGETPFMIKTSTSWD